MISTSVHVRAWLGLVIVVALGFLFAARPGALDWLHAHRLAVVALTLAGGLFHLWNTYAAWPPAMR